MRRDVKSPVRKFPEARYICVGLRGNEGAT